MALKPTTRALLAAKHGKSYAYRNQQAQGIKRARAAGRGAGVKQDYISLGKQNLSRKRV
jgi:hypothetical protein